MIREALWWVDEHRGWAALAALVLVAAVAVAILVGGGGDSAAGPRADLEAALADPELAPRIPERGNGGSPEAQTKVDEGHPLSAAGKASPGARKVERAKPPKPCEESAAGAIVEVSVTAADCEAAAPLLASFRDGPRAGTETIAGFTCTAAEGSLVVSCLRANDAALVVLRYGPGEPGLADCGQVPVGPDATPIPVRSSLGCAKAGPVAFGYHGSRAGGVEGFDCRTREQTGIEVVECARSGGVVAFVAAS